MFIVSGLTTLVIVYVVLWVQMISSSRLSYGMW